MPGDISMLRPWKWKPLRIFSDDAQRFTPSYPVFKMINTAEAH
jgi:hypothetical protein